MPLVSPGNNPKIVLDSYLDNSEFDKKVQELNTRLDAVSGKLKAQNETLTQSAKQSTMSWTDFRSAYQVAMDVVRVGEQVWGATVEKAQEYDQSIRDIMLSTGATAEESSRLVQVVDDAGVSYGTLKTALKMASKDGIEPNIESIKKLSDEYLKLSPGVERNQFLLDKFGKSGLEMARVMELGSTAIGKMNDGISGGLVLTQEAIDQSEEYRKNVDELKDSWDGFVISMGNAVIPAVNDFIESQKKSNKAMQEAYDKTGSTNYRVLQHEAALILEHDAQIAAADAVAEHGDKLDGVLTPALENATDSMQDFTMSFDDQLKTATQLTGLSQDYAKSQEEVTAKIAEKEKELQELKAQGWWDESEKVKAVQSDIEELNGKYEENATAYEERTNRILLSMTLEKIAMMDGEAGFSEAEYAKALAVSETLGAVEAASLRETMAMDAVSTAVAEGTLKAQDMKKAMDLLESKTITLTVNQVTNMISADNMAAQQDYRAGHATGGTFMIPQSYGNEGFMLGGGDTASGGEKLQIIPQGKNEGSLDTDRIVAAIMSIKTDETKLSRLILEGTLEKTR